MDRSRAAVALRQCSRPLPLLPRPHVTRAAALTAERRAACRCPLFHALCVLQDGVVLGADTRSTAGTTVADKNCEKIHYIGRLGCPPCWAAGLCWPGAAGPAQRAAATPSALHMPALRQPRSCCCACLHAALLLGHFTR